MISLRKVLLGICLVAGLALLSSCGGSDDDDDEVCLGGLFCPNFGTEVITCCTSSRCYYETNGQTFNCDGTVCDFQGAPQLANYCVGRGKDDLETNLFMERSKNQALRLLLDQAHEDTLE